MPINTSTSPGIFWWRPTCWLHVSGVDAANFLQGQFTQDLRGLTPGRAIYGVWLNVKGKVLADSFIVAGVSGSDFWVGSYYSAAATIRERLESFVIADDVTVEDFTAEWAGVSLMGTDAERLAAAPPAEGFLFHGRRVRPFSQEWVFPIGSEAAARVRLAGAVEQGEADLARFRWEMGIPAVPADIGPGDLPNEGGLDADAISYTKGCYLGQEVMARLKSMGRVRRRLLRVAGPDQNLPSLPARLFAQGRDVGELRSVIRLGDGLAGFAMLSLPNITAESRLGLVADAPGALHLVDAP